MRTDATKSITPQRRAGLVRFLQAAVLIGLCWGAVGAGCVSDSGGRSDRRDRYDNRYDDTYARAGGYDAGRTTEGSARKNVPRDAKLVAEDRGGVSFRARDDGYIWVTESTYDEVIFDSPIRGGSDFVLDAKRDRGFFNGREILQGRLKNDIKYRIYFARDRR